jgi:hypothetical protein
VADIGRPKRIIDVPERRTVPDTVPENWPTREPSTEPSQPGREAPAPS